MGTKVHRTEKTYPKNEKKDMDIKSEAIKLERNEKYLRPLKFSLCIREAKGTLTHYYSRRNIIFLSLFPAVYSQILFL